MTIIDTRGHHIPLQGALNFRDFGGYKNQDNGYIAPNFFFRSDKLDKLTDDDHAVLDKFNIEAIFDLRRPDEQEYAPTRWLPNTSTTIHSCSLIRPEHSTRALMKQSEKFADQNDPAQAMMQELYRQLVIDPQSRKFLAQIFMHLLTRPKQPMLVHCSGGKDRTGVTCALILWALGCDQHTIYADYMLSKSLYCDQVDSTAKFQQMAKGNNDDALNPLWIKAVMSVFPEYLDAMFDAILADFEGIDDYLEKGLGLPSDTPKRLQDMYVIRV